VISTSTVFVLGAGASAPYEFDTGRGLLERARALSVHTIAERIAPLPRQGAPDLHDALGHTGESSIDAMLEARVNIQAPGKALMARLLLEQEREALKKRHTSARGWYRTLFSAMDAPSPQEALDQKIRFVTFNYDRSLEYFLWHAWRVKFNPDLVVDPAALRRMFIHVHGQLGFLPEVGGGVVVSYGGGAEEITDGDVLEASKSIKIISEPHPNDPQFVEARKAIKQADRLVFLGFGFSPRNLERLQLSSVLKPGAAVFACATGFSENRMKMYVRKPLEPWPGKVIGREGEDARRR
jgi:hypothetical protein